MRTWHYELRGGAYDGFGFDALDEPQGVMVAWRCGPRCEGHASFDPCCPAVVLRTAESYRLAERDDESRRAVYDVGESGPRREVEERELVGVGAGGEPVTAFTHLGAGWRN